MFCFSFLPLFIFLFDGRMINGFLLDDNDVIKVSTPVGEIVGEASLVSINSTFGYRVQKFWGIPYAEAPTGDLRFRKPVRKSNFTTPFDARQQGASCYQFETPLFPSQYPRSEDCLVLNIFAPENTRKVKGQLKSVFVWIHGGGFLLGESNGYEGGYLASIGDVIVVTLNYRLTLYGFLTTGDSVVPDNLGLRDQQLAIKWVKENIEAFGGDGNDITIAGESAGSASVVFQSFHPGNKGLFHRAIAMSGSVFSPWTVMDVDTAKEKSQEFVDIAGCGTGTQVQQLDCMRKLPISVLNDTVQSTGGVIFPVIGGDFAVDTPEGKDMFLSVDLMIGVTNGDGIVDLQTWLFWINQTDPSNFYMPKNVYEDIAIPYYLSFYFGNNVTQGAMDLTLHDYTDWSDPDDGLKREKELVKLATDTLFTVPAVKTANMHTAGNRSTFLYEFSVRPLFHQLAVPPSLDGPDLMNHGDDEHFLFGKGLMDTSENETLDRIYDTYLATIMMWSNFAKSGDPNGPVNVSSYINVTWPDYSDDKAYLELTTHMDDNSTNHRLRPGQVNLWTNLLPAILQNQNLSTFD